MKYRHHIVIPDWENGSKYRVWNEDLISHIYYSKTLVGQFAVNCHILAVI